MTKFKLYGNTFPIKDKIASFAKGINGFSKYDGVLSIILTNAKTTKKRTNLIYEFAKENNLKCYENKFDGSKFTPSNKQYSGFAKALK